jgi:hypothetical protein
VAWNRYRNTPARYMSRMSPIIVALAVFAGHPEADAAFADYARYPSSVYLSLAECPAERRDELEKVLRFVVPSLSSKSYLGDQLPVRVPGTNLLRLNLDGLGWLKTWEQVIRTHYVPVYRPDLAHLKAVPLVVNGQWFAATVMDSQLTGDSQYRLIYGVPPKNVKEFQAHWQVNAKGNLSFGRVEGKSGVSVQSTRVLENQASGNRGYSWVTFDARVVAGQTDPLENLTARPIKHDASELIAAIPKHMNGQSGTLQAYFLADGNGNRQEKAPADIVTDTTGTRGVEIRNTLSCIACHEAGILEPTLDQYREYILSGARITTKDKNAQQEIDRYLDSPIAKEIRRNNEDYEAGVAMCNGLTARENAIAFKNVVRAWDAPVTPEQAALELYAKPEEWRLALGNYSRTYQLSGRLAIMAQGEAISRQQWEANYKLAQQVLYAWHASH